MYTTKVIAMGRIIPFIIMFITLDETKGSLPWFLFINASFFAYKVDNQE